RRDGRRCGRGRTDPLRRLADHVAPMSRWTWLGIGLVLLGAFAGTPGLLLVGALLILSSVVRDLWSRYGLSRLTYQRHLVRDRAVLGEEVELQVSAWNDKLL